MIQIFDLITNDDNVGLFSCSPRPIKFQERSRAGAQMLCLSFSPGK